MEGLKATTKTGGRVTPAKLLRRFCKDRRGSTAIEFAILALPFFVVLFAILEMCVSFAAQQVITNATDEIGRKYRTGELKPADINQQELRAMLCERISVIVSNDCPGLNFDLQSFETFQSISDELKRNPIPSTYKYLPGEALTKNMLRVFYEWPVMTNIMAARAGDTALLFATTTWQNEPFN
ncbi:TadE/TadG family type IV pilus assembly protein [Chelativorans salis]|uniref:Pilus assembly protein n=1 Tax=Chelativorans salis TaxID=2978478 RepID=A0ABT2LMX3_9HYPH|nr:TadE/TadG family type IV pilus assembly protein [Chelativorans sp. EGI FJ00035]MCT7374524.1 pilus assembly protein [Chelativorans sp. EGI FJ00035]